jgi:two-component system response regulator PilR (NtrC family)
VLGTGGPLEPRDFALGNGHSGSTNGRHANGGPPAAESGGTLDLKTQVEAIERQAILKALEASGGNRRQAASLLGISLRTLFYKMRRLPVH